jgi:arginase
LRLAGLRAALEATGQTVRDRQDLLVPDERPAAGGISHFDAYFEVAEAVSEATERSIEEGALPLVLGGDHSIAAASVAAALRRLGDGVALLWIDAHADLNTPGSTPSGNLHGMPVAALQGLPSGVEEECDAQWRRLLEHFGMPKLRPEMTAWYGIRDVDAPERERIHGLAITMHDLDRYGVERTVDRLDEWLFSCGARHLWISFDVDVLDPFLAPGTGTAVRGGLTYRESHLLAELLREALDQQGCPYRLAGLDVVEVNPLFDAHNETAKVAVEWVASLFGKTILGKR